MGLKHRGLILLGAGLFGVALVGCQESNESAFRKSAPAAVQNANAAKTSPKNQMEYYQQQKAREGGMKNYPGMK